MKKTPQYKYKVCSLCKRDKIENRSPYCRECGSEYSKKYRLIKKLTPNVNLDGLGAFINKIVKNKMDVTFHDINNIIFFYEIITNDINEYDQYNGGKQIVLMYERIVDYYESKKTKKENNI